jgi:hypothetical protein
MDADDELEIRPVEIVFRGETEVCVSGGLAAGERLVVTDLPAPVAGMPLRLDGAPGGREAPDGGRSETVEATR